MRVILEKAASSSSRFAGLTASRATCVSRSSNVLRSAWSACCRISGDSPELLHLAVNREAAELWLANNQYSRAYLEEVSADEIGADIIEGRSAA